MKTQSERSGDYSLTETLLVYGRHLLYMLATALFLIIAFSFGVLARNGFVQVSHFVGIAVPLGFMAAILVMDRKDTNPFLLRLRHIILWVHYVILCLALTCPLVDKYLETVGTVPNVPKISWGPVALTLLSMFAFAVYVWYRTNTSCPTSYTYTININEPLDSPKQNPPPRKKKAKKH